MTSSRSASALVVVPCYNEARRLDAAAVEAFESFCQREPGIDFVFVDDGSEDATPERLALLESRLEGRATRLRHDTNRGKGEAVRTGIEWALARGTADYVGYWDADLSTPLDEIPRFVEILDTRPDVDTVLGSRVKLLGRTIERRAVRHYLGRIFATAASQTLDLPVYDTQCGAKLFRSRPELVEVFREPFVSRWLFDVEILARMIRARRGGDAPPVSETVVELPLDRWCDVAGSKVGPADFFRAFLDLYRIHRRTLRKEVA